MVRQSGEVFEEFYDVQTGLLRVRHTTDERTGGSLRLLATFDDYRRFGDWMLAARQSYKLTGGPQVLTIMNAQWDIKPDAVFDLPAEVKSRLALKGVSNFGVRWQVKDLQAEGLKLAAGLGQPKQWQVSQRGAFESGFGDGIKPPAHRFHVPFIVMTAGDAEEFKLRHGDLARPASPIKLC